MALSTSFRLSPSDIANWQAVLVRNQISHWDIGYGLLRYPGQLMPGEVLPENSTAAAALEACMDQITLENEDFSRSFLLRTLESRWSVERLRTEIIDKSPTLVRPQAGFTAAVQTIREAIEALLARLSDDPQPGDLGDVRIYTLICRNRDRILNLSRELLALEAEKSLHDALQQLQIQASQWLDLAPPQDGGEPGSPEEPEEPGHPATFAGLAFGAKHAIEAILADLPVAENARAQTCIAALDEAIKRIQSGDVDEIEFAGASLRAMLFRELPAISDAMFRISSDLPLREFRAVFAGQDVAIVAVVELCDRLRRRIMAHSLWQSCDLKVYAIELLFANPTARLFADLRSHLSILRVNLGALMAIPLQQPGPTAALDKELRLYDQSLPDDAEPETLDSVPASWLKALAMLRDSVRSRFLDENQRLNADIGEIVSLREPLRLMLRRVSPFCEQNLVP